MTPSIPGVELGPALGRGAFGVVHKARHLALDVDVAVKLLDPDPDADADRILREARLMARLDHPNLLRVHDAGRAGHRLYLILEFMDGGSLAHVHRAPPAAVLDAGRQLLSGLQALHDARILHRDIKPANVLKRLSDGRLKLADLGIAVQQRTADTAPADLVGTLAFMAPELFDSPPAYSERSDLYALGLTLACLALDAAPWPAESTTDVLRWIHSGARPRLAATRRDLPPDLAALIDRMIAPDPARRPASAAEALASISGATAATSPQPAEVEAIGPWLLGSLVFEDANWSVRAVTHRRSGASARLSHLLPYGTLSRLSLSIAAGAERAARQDHPHILRVLDWGLHYDRVYVVTPPWGRVLSELVREQGPLTEPEALSFGVSLADALVYLHERRLVFQLVAPGTIHVSRDGRTVQLSWPVHCVPEATAARDDTGVVVRVILPPFAAPEAFGGKGEIRAPVDVYGLGATLFFLMTGEVPFAGEWVEEILAQKTRPPNASDHRPEITRRTALLLQSLMDPAPGSRPGAADAKRELERLRRDLGGLS